MLTKTAILYFTTEPGTALLPGIHNYLPKYSLQSENISKQQPITNTGRVDTGIHYPATKRESIQETLHTAIGDEKSASAALYVSKSNIKNIKNNGTGCWYIRMVN